MAAEVKHSYTVSCASAFRDAALALADNRRVNVGDLARSVMLVVPAEEIEGFPDPGDPPPGDRETVVLKSGPSEGRPWRRKPRLQVRMSKGYDPVFIRKAIGIALAMENGSVAVSLGGGARHVEEARNQLQREFNDLRAILETEKREIRQETDRARDEIERLRTMVTALVNDPPPRGIVSRQDALHVMGFPPGTWPDSRQVKTRFRVLATIHHPDSDLGSHERMSLLNQAMELLRDR